ncbi:MAG: hypothetical protein F6K24_21775 [Okeania sp. SIO2D1]|nr:hypothetical protein [Okeania sp. SIO2D1]
MQASENENIGGFSMSRDGWKDLMREKQSFMVASQDESISDIAPGKFPEYSIVSDHGNYVE